jgi:DNA-binding transcriptional LysR family regulator
VEIRHLRYFVAAATHCHFGRAAEELKTAQPNLTRHIKALEEELGTLLFSRAQRRVALTRDGEDLLAAANRALRLLGAIKDGGYRRGAPREVTVAHVPAALTAVVPRYLRLWKRLRPTVRFQLSEGFPLEVSRALSAGDADLGFTVEPPERVDLASRRIASFPYQVALPIHASSRRSVSLTALRGLNWVTIPDKLRPRPSCPLLLRMETLGFHRERRTIVGSQQALLGMVAAGEGFAILPAHIRKLNQPGVVFRSAIEELPSFDIYLAWRKDEEDAAVLAMSKAAPG